MNARPDAQAFAENFTRVTQATQAVMQSWLARETSGTPSLSAQFGAAYLDYLAHCFRDPEKLRALQMEWGQEYLQFLEHATKRMLGEEGDAFIEPERKDKRFRDAAWQENALFDFIKQSYLLTARRIQRSVQQLEGLNPHEARKLDFYTRQFVDAMAPSNFLMTNPEALRLTLETGGQNLVQGAENLLADMESSKGNLRIRMTDMQAFELGRNLATSPGKVVFENTLMQLIQYEPSTAQVHQTPLLLMPAWINKYYIFDLSAENSFVKWAVAEGYTVFVISWVNPDETLAGKRFDDYLTEGPLASLDAIEQATGEKQVSIIGYCLGGTLLSIALAWLKAKGQAHRVASATFLTTMMDFREAGELSVFIDEPQLEALEARMAEKGYLEGEEMSGTFNLLRANDLIWSFVVNHYLLGKDPFPFDLLYWNADATRMPAAMHSFYLRRMYQQNDLVKARVLEIAGEPIDLYKIDTPSYILSTREDHIAPWKSTYEATQIFHGDVTFVLAASGHVAGVINPPAKGNKYGHWTNDTCPSFAEDWLAGATEQTGSWWPHWSNWQKKFAGPLVAAREVGAGKLKPIEKAPGRYAKGGELNS